MPHPFHPQDFPIDEDRVFQPNQVFYLKGAIHFKKTAQIMNLSGMVRQRFSNFSPAFLQDVQRANEKAQESPTYEIKSCGEMMRTIKTMTNSSGEKLCDLNITFISFDSSTVKFPKDSPHSRHPIEMCPVGNGADEKHEAFVKNSIPYFWDMTSGQFGVLYKCLNQKRVEIAKVCGYGFAKDAVLVLDGRELDDVVALATVIILLNGRDAMDA